MADWVKTNQEVAMNLKQIQLSLDPRVVARLALLAEEQQMTLAGLITDALDRHLDDVRHRRTQADPG